MKGKMLSKTTLLISNVQIGKPRKKKKEYLKSTYIQILLAFRTIVEKNV